jgi:hypothetical protein
MPGTETDLIMFPLLPEKNDLRHKKTQKREEDNNLLWTKSVQLTFTCYWRSLVP